MTSRPPSSGLQRLTLGLLLVAGATLASFTAGAAFAAAFLIPPGQGLTGATEVIAYGLFAMLAGLVLSIWAALRLSLPVLRRAAFWAGLVILLLAALFVWRLYSMQQPRQAQSHLMPTAIAAEPVDHAPQETFMRNCGLDARLALDAAQLQPVTLHGDFDADGAPDQAAFVMTEDGRHGIAICRAGSKLDLLMGGAVRGSDMPSFYFDQLEAWHVSKMDAVQQGWEGEAPRPQVKGDVIVLERIEKSMYSLYWDGDAFKSHKHYVYVEP